MATNDDKGGTEINVRDIPNLGVTESESLTLEHPVFSTIDNVGLDWSLEKQEEVLDRLNEADAWLQEQFGTSTPQEVNVDDRPYWDIEPLNAWFGIRAEREIVRAAIESFGDYGDEDDASDDDDGGDFVSVGIQ